MSRVFIAYKRSDAERVAVVREKLEALGVPLFIDLQIQSGVHYIFEINKNLKEAIAVLVFWSEAAITPPKANEQNFFMSEAHKGYDLGKQVAATFDNVVLDNLPVPFNLYQAADLSDWIGNGTPADHRGWQRLLEGLAVRLQRPGLPTLARVLENGDEQAKSEFLKSYPDDPFAETFAADIIEKERKEFDQRIAAAQARIDRRRRDAEAVLKVCRKEFETQLAQLRTGGEFFPPDPVNALEDNVAKLNDQIEIYETRLAELQSQAEQSDATIGQAREQIDQLIQQIAVLDQQRADAEREAAKTKPIQLELASLQQEAAAKDGALASRASEIEALGRSLKEAKQAHDGQRRDIKKLQAENVTLKSQLPDAPWSIWRYPKLLFVAGAAAGMLAGGVVVMAVGGSGGGGGAEAGTPSVVLAEKEQELKRKEQELSQKSAKLYEREDQLNADVAKFGEQKDNIEERMAALTKTAQDTEARSKALDARERKLVSGEQSLDARQKSLAERKEKMDRELNRKSADLERRETQIAPQIEEFAKKETDLKRKQAAVAAAMQELDRRAKDLDSRELELASNKPDTKAERPLIASSTIGGAADAATERPKTVPPPEPQLVGGIMSKFAVASNVDIYGQDIPQPNRQVGIPNIDIDACAASCDNDNACMAFSYDRWKTVCYLKNKIVTPVLEPRSITGVKKPATVPSVSNAPTKIEVIPNRRFPGEPTRSTGASDLQTCRDICSDDRKCVAFTFLKTGRAAQACRVYTEAKKLYIPDVSSDSGYKYQPPGKSGTRR